MANYKELLMPVELEDLSDDEEEIVEDGVLYLLKTIKEKRIQTQYLDQIFEKVKEELAEN